ncbi:MAG: aldolase/citrate lyase family protein, partial [Pseudomonadota bacterium]
MTLTMRSWLFAPGDSEKKMGKAIAGEADIALLDLEDSVTPENKPAARELVAGMLAEAQDRSRLWVRINPLDTPDAVLDLAVMPHAPGGLFLPKAEGAHHVSQLHHYLTALEAAHSLPQGSTKIAALVTET